MCHTPNKNATAWGDQNLVKIFYSNIEQLRTPQKQSQNNYICYMAQENHLTSVQDYAHPLSSTATV